MATLKTRSFRNRILSRLPAEALDSFGATLSKIDLPRRLQIERPNRRIDYVVFPEEGIASIVAAPDRKTQAEIGIIGLEGVTGLPIMHLNDQGPYSAYMQVAGFGYRAHRKDVLDLMNNSLRCRQLFLAFAQSFLIQTAETAVANARATIEDRLARWLLMAQDRVQSDTIPLTHEFLSLMMAARRAGVTEAVHELERKGLVVGKRGMITVLNRKGLEKCAGGYYGRPEAELSRLLRAAA